MRAVFLDSGSLDAGDLDWSRLNAVLPDLVCHESTSPDRLAARLEGAAVAITNKVRLDADTFAAAPDLRLVCVAATGTDNVDIAAAAHNGVLVCNVRNYATPSVVQHVLALMLALRCRLPGWQQRLRRGEWSRSRHFSLLEPDIEELVGQTIGIIGHGVLGQAVAHAAEALGMEVLVAERRNAAHVRPGRLPFETVLTQADVVSLHAPLTPDTRHLMNRETLSLMKPGALLINTARGGLVDETALLEVLHNGHLGGAGLDVLSQEPPPPDHPLLVADLPQLIVTPHVAWASRAARQRLLDQLAHLVSAWLQGRAIHVVQP